MRMTNESLETQASIMLKNAADHLATDQWNQGYDKGDWQAINILDSKSSEVYFSAEWTFGEPLY